MLPVETPFKTYTDLDGKPLDCGSIYFGQPGLNPITSPVTVYWDAAGTQPALQPLRTINGYIVNKAGAPANVFYDGSYSELVQDKHGCQVFYARTSDDFSIGTMVSALFNSAGASKIGVAQGGTVQDRFDHAVINVKDAPYNAKGDGVTDDTAAIQAALNTGKAVYFPAPAVAYYITTDLLPQANQLIYGDGYDTLIQMKDGTINGFYGSSVDRVTICDLRISTKSQTGATAYKAAINLVSCDYCAVDRVYVDGMGYQGVRLYDSNFCRIERCTFTAFFGAIQDQADIAVMNNSSYNLIDGNVCLGGSAGSGDHGIFVQDPYTASTPTGNVITNNQVGQHNANGILVYVTHAFDTQTIVANNRINGILGTSLSGQSGAGIYIQSAGGTIVTGNEVWDCCKQTTSFSTQGVAHISVAIGTYTTGQLVPVIVSNNRINAPRGPGIWCASSDAVITVDNNPITISSTGSGDEGRGIYAINCNGVRIINNPVTQLNPNFQTIQVAAVGQNVANTDVSHNIVETVAYGIAVNIAPGGTHSDVTASHNRVFGGNQTAMTLEVITNLTSVGNDVESSGIAFTATSITNGRFTVDRLISSLTGYGVIFTGTGSNNIVDETNILGAVVQNDATSGTLISQYGSSAPAISGLWAVGDRVIAKAPAVGDSKGARCTVAGNPGTWTSEGVL